MCSIAASFRERAQAEPELRAEGSLCYNNIPLYLVGEFEDQKQIFVKYPYAKMSFYTIRDNAKRLNMNKIQKFFDKFCSHYIIVQSPKNGEHYHALVVKSGKPPYLRGATHLHCSQVGGERENYFFQELFPRPPPDPIHPYHSCRVVGIQLLIVCSELRVRFGGPRGALQHRMRSRRLAAESRTRKQAEINRIIAYLAKNLGENANPIYYDHMLVKR